MTRASTHQDSKPQEAEATLPAPARRAVMLTRISLWAEALARAFWPAASLLVAGAAALALGAGRIPYLGGWLGPLLVLALTGLAWFGWRRFHRPVPDAALHRVDAGLTGRPLATLTDRVALGRDDPAAMALWAAHHAKALAGAKAARPILPRAGLAVRDPYGLRLMAATTLAMGLIFGNIAGLAHGWGALAASLGSRPPVTPDQPAAPNWEGWAEPPAHTRRPTLYLNTLPEGEDLTLPQGTRVTLRLYGGAEFAQDIGPDDSKATDAPGFTAEQDGTITLPDRQIAVTIIPDHPPEIRPGPPAERRNDGRLAQSFNASDDYGVTRGKAEITLDLEAVDRRFGRKIAPEPREALSLDLPLPARGRDAIRGTLSADLARHPFANLPVTLRFEVEDGLGQKGEAKPLSMTLPGRRFFDPMAAALIELRQALLWSRENRSEVAQILRAITWEGENRLSPELASGLEAVIAQLEDGPLQDKSRDNLAEILWQSAVLLEDGGLSDALERMKRAQERLSEAIRQGASPDEIARLMRELREATDAYSKMQAEQGDAPEDRFTRKQPTQEITGSQLQEMMDEIERLTREGRMAEAQELLEQFNRLMEQLEFKFGEGQSGEGRDGGEGTRGELTDTLRRQQGLADEALRQQRDEQGRWRPSQPGDADDLADQQRELREELGRQRGLMQGMDEGDTTGEALDEAGRAMDEAEEALRNGDIGGAMQRQAEAIEQLREGIRRRGQQNEEARSGEGGQQAEGNDGSGETGGGDGFGGAWERTMRDPLGRSSGVGGGRITTDGGLDEGSISDPVRRARDLLDEIRRRAGETARSQDERDYLGRLLDRF